MLSFAEILEAIRGSSLYGLLSTRQRLDLVSYLLLISSSPLAVEPNAAG
jgi:hypothetical protein